MIGDVDDFRRRLRLTLPARWFSDIAPVLDGVLSGLSTGWSVLYQLFLFVVQQSRLRTATGAFLEMAAQDYLSDSLPRRADESDDSYRQRLLLALRRFRATRASINEAANSAGYAVNVFEAAQPRDTGVYNGSSCLAWSTIGAWGSMQMPLESLIVAHPQADHQEDELWKNLAHSAPAGGAIWVRIAADL